MGTREAGQSVVTGKPQRPSVDRSRAGETSVGDKGGMGYDIPVRNSLIGGSESSWGHQGR